MKTKKKNTKEMMKNTKKKKTDTLYVPEEIIMSILRRLPLKSLLRFRFVSKQWSSFISQITIRVPKFLFPYEKHYKRSRYDDDDDNDDDDGYFPFRSIDQSIQVEEIDMAMGKNIACKTPLSCQAHRAQIHGSCNGLLLIGLCGNFCLWNPSIRRCVRYWQSNYNPNQETIPGLCFDSRNNSYKFVVVWSNHSFSSGEALVGNFETRLGKSVRFPYCSGSFRPGPVFNNHPHWWHRLSFGSCDIIVYFDSKMDEFVNLPVPSPGKDERATSDCLVVFDGCLCMGRYYPKSALTKVLLMKEYGVKESWTLFFKFEHEFRNCSYVVPLFLRNEKKREVLMLVRKYIKKNIIVAYDIDNNVYEGKVVASVGESFTDPVEYEETMIRPTWGTEPHTRPKIVWNVEDDEIIPKNDKLKTS